MTRIIGAGRSRLLQSAAMKTAFVFILGCALAAASHAQQHHPYAGQQSREIKALSGGDLQGLLDGEGQGAAKPAELNGYPGPSHVLALAQQLELSAEQAEASRRLMVTHKESARRLGALLVEKERALDRAFASGQADEATVQRLSAEIAVLQGQLRAEHLVTHLRQAVLLSAAQRTRYAELRGYGTPASRH